MCVCVCMCACVCMCVCVCLWYICVHIFLHTPQRVFIHTGKCINIEVNNMYD